MEQSLHLEVACTTNGFSTEHFLKYYLIIFQNFDLYLSLESRLE